MQRGIAAGCDQVAAGCVQGRWQREIAAAAMETNGSERSLLVAFVPRGIAAGCDQGGWQRVVAVGSVVQREMRAAVEGIREIGWLKGWWTEGGRLRFSGVVCGCFGCGLGLRFYGVLAAIGVLLFFSLFYFLPPLAETALLLLPLLLSPSLD
ncbi:hypothetical protein BHM03_00020986 [Ensete ventricosum]|uniref:Uncharacterized protein n=1 Tax=Ensete ventricosum TaxID=4639 RepID=A0A445MG17_ENSVE|nr:hypothetical protein BHM03_00020986 [Ensete ventricosum]